MDGATRKRLAALTVALVLVTPLSVVAARWQWNRHLERDALNAAVLHAEQTPPVPWQHLASGAGFTAATEWRRVTAVGHWVTDRQLLIRKQSVNGAVGFTLVDPFDTVDGARLLVQVGWVPDTVDPASAAVHPTLPAETTTVTLRVRMVTGDGPMAPSDLPPGQVNRVDPQQLPTAWWEGRESVPALFELLDPVPTTLVPLPWPVLTSGPHLSYFVQWILIGLTGIVVYVRVFASEVRLSREAADETPTDDQAGAGPAPDTE